MELTNTLSFLAAPFAMCLILAGIHCYLGLHVLARGVIFVDLSLAQVAAFGATCAVFLGLDHHSVETYFVSLGATFLGAALFALARRHENLFSQEAIIGIVYALASASVVLVVDKIAHGAEHIKDLLVGQVLWVTWPEVYKTAAIYGCVSVVHFVFRKQLIRTSFGLQKEHRGFWDFLFYALFGVVITSSVSIAGVLQVFA
ncbi:MAG: metal ABC transporter permease, partial [Bdellovibrionales bacterium]|nr:metal ABC transporter permease [Bdellovibrionales bacterium]